MAAVSHIGRLNNLLINGKKADPAVPSTVERVIEVARKTIGITEENYLEWNERYDGGTGYINGITHDALGGRKLVWGIDPNNRIFIAFQYAVKVEGKGEYQGRSQHFKKTSTFFQRHSDWLGLIAQGDEADGLCIGQIEWPQDKHSLQDLETLFSGKKLTQEGYDADKTFEWLSEDTPDLPTKDSSLVMVPAATGAADQE
jgi:hypothetical protein